MSIFDSFPSFPQNPLVPEFGEVTAVTTEGNIIVVNTQVIVDRYDKSKRYLQLKEAVDAIWSRKHAARDTQIDRIISWFNGEQLYSRKITYGTGTYLNGSH